MRQPHVRRVQEPEPLAEAFIAGATLVLWVMAFVLLLVAW